MKFIKPIPRGVYYLSFYEIIKSIFSLPFSNLKSKKYIEEYESSLKKLFEVDGLVLMPHARVCVYYILSLYNYPRGSEVLMSPTTLPDMVNMVLLLGLKPVFVDFSADIHGCLANDIKPKINDKTKALIVTNLYGLIYDLSEISNLCKKNNILFIQDNTQSYLCEYNNQQVHNFSDWSFSSTCALKDIHTHMGAFIIGKNEAKLNSLRENIKRDFKLLSKRYFLKFLKEDLIASVGLNRNVFSFFHYWIFKIIFIIDMNMIDDLIDAKGISVFGKRFFKGLFGGSGYKRRTSVPQNMLYHFSGIQARKGLVTIKSIRSVQNSRIANSHYILSKLSKRALGQIPKFDPQAKNCFWRLPIFVDNLDDFRKYLFSCYIDPGKTTLPCLPELNIFKEFSNGEDFVVSRTMGENSIFIPNYHYLSMNDLNYIVEVINNYFERIDEYVQ